MSHNSQDSIRAELEVLSCSCLRRPQPLCGVHLARHIFWCWAEYSRRAVFILNALGVIDESIPARELVKRGSTPPCSRDDVGRTC
jgi:hypothetical protein